jgi:hypothetical protein
VTVNRFWQEVFGTGIVRPPATSASGRTAFAPGTARLAGRRVPRSGWDVKQFFKLMVMSATYRQSAVATPEKLERTRTTGCCRAARGSAWTPRWSATTPWPPAACWSPKIGGPSVKPYQPPGVWEAVAMIGSNTRDYSATAGENLYRRSMYTFWKRSAPPASMDIFNAPSREVCTVRRERTNTPLQALVTLNDPQFVEAARHLAQPRCPRRRLGRRSRLDYLAKRLLCRPLDAAELPVVQASLADLSAYYAAHAEDAQSCSPSANPNPIRRWTPRTGRLDDAGQPVDEPGRGAEQVTRGRVRAVSNAI